MVKIRQKITLPCGNWQNAASNVYPSHSSFSFLIPTCKNIAFAGYSKIIAEESKKCFITFVVCLQDKTKIWKKALL